MTLVQLIEISGNVNHAVSITECWIYDSNYKRALTLIKEHLDIICFPSKDYKIIYAKFKDVYFTIRYMNPKGNLQILNRKRKFWTIVLSKI